MKKTLFLMLAMCFAGVMYGQDKQVAVLQPRVIGSGVVSTNDQLIITSSMRKAFTQMDGYEAYTRTSQSLIAAEQAFQRSGYVAESQIKAVGQQTGVAYICVFTLSKNNKELVVNSEILNVVTGKIENSDFVVLYDISDRENVTNKCLELAYNLLGVTYNPQQRKQNNNTKTSSVSSSDYVIIDGVKWAKKNVGTTQKTFVSSPEDYGGYYTWYGAKTACPNGWRLPTEDEQKNLNNVGSTWTSLNGKNGRKFGDSNYIFMPAAGYQPHGYSHLGADDSGHYWSSTPTSYSIDPDTWVYILNFSKSSSYAGFPCTNKNNAEKNSVRCVAE